METLNRPASIQIMSTYHNVERSTSSCNFEFESVLAYICTGFRLVIVTGVHMYISICGRLTIVHSEQTKNTGIIPVCGLSSNGLRRRWLIYANVPRQTIYCHGYSLHYDYATAPASASEPHGAVLGNRRLDQTPYLSYSRYGLRRTVTHCCV